MKVFAGLVLVAAIAATTFAAPATKAVDWDAVSAKVSEVESSVRDNAQQILSLANNENEAVGSTISEKVNVASAEAALVLQAVNDAVAAQTLTVGQVRALNSQLKGVVGRLRGAISADLAQLTPVTAGQIRAVFTATFDRLDVLANELSALLAAPASTLVVDWNAVSGKIGEIEEVVRANGQAVVDAASAESETIANSIAGKVSATASNVRKILDEANAAVTAQTLTDLQAQDLVSQLKGNIARLIGSLAIDLALLTPEKGVEIRAIFTNTFDTIDLRAAEISALLLA